MRRPVLVVSAVAPVPPDNGKRVVLTGLLGYLVDRFGGDRVHYALVAAPGTSLPTLPCQVHRLAKPRAVDQVRNVAWQSLATRRRSLQEAMLFSRPLRRQVARLVQELDPAIEVYDTVRMGQHRPVTGRPGLRVLYLDDLFSVRYARMLGLRGQLSKDLDPLGEFAAHVPAPLRGVTRSPMVHRPLLRWEKRRIEQRERDIVRSFDTSLLVSGAEVADLRDRTGLSSIREITPLVPSSGGAARAPALPPEFVFVGLLTLPHNDDAICTFLRTVLSKLRARQPQVRIRIIGKGASAELLGLAAAAPANVSVEGYVEDLDLALARASAMLAPLRFGSGVKIKVLEALARGVPVLGTPVAFEGVPARPDGADGCVVAEDLASWEGVMSEIADPARNATLSDAAAAFFKRRYARDVVYRQYDRIFQTTDSS